MFARNTKIIGKNAAGKDITSCTIVANTTPGTLPTTGEGITNLGANNVFAPMSVLYVTDIGAVYIANEDGEFVLQ